MKKISPFLFMMFLGSVLFADLDKHQKYGTMPIEYDPVPVFINPDYIDIYRNEVTITVGGDPDSEFCIRYRSCWRYTASIWWSLFQLSLYLMECIC